MARTGITQSEVFEAANELISAGIKPTIEQIRNILKTGSNTTIALHLRHWHALKQTECKPVSSDIKFPHEIVESINKLWDELTARATLKIQEISTQHESAMQDLQQALEKYKFNNKRWQDLHTKWQAEKTLLNEQLQQASETIKGLSDVKQQQYTEIESQKAKLAELKSRISELNQLFKQAQDNLEHFRESVRIQRQDEQYKYENEKKQLSTEIKNLHENVLLLKTQEAKLLHQNQLLQHHHEELRDDILNKNKTLQNCLDEINKLELNNQVFMKQTKQLQAENDGYKADSAKNEKSLIEKEIELKALKAHVAYLEQQLSENRNTIISLEKERWVRQQKKSSNKD